MKDSLWKMLGFVLAMFLLVFVPLMQLYQSQEDIVNYRVIDLTESFLSRVRASGYIDDVTFLQFQSELDSYTKGYKVEFTHKAIDFFPSPTENYFDNETSFFRNYRTYTNNDILNKIFPTNSKESKNIKLYKMKAEDIFIVDVKKVNKTGLDELRSFLFKSESFSPFHIRFSTVIGG